MPSLADMGAQWKHSLRQGVNEKKGKIVGKIVKEIIVSTKMGGIDPASNFRLRGALEDARKNSVPRDTIERAIKRGSGQTDDTIQFETILYEGFAPHQVPLIVEVLTDNKNRTVAEIRGLFRKGQLGSAGSVAWMFERKGVVDALLENAKPGDVDLESIAIEGGADDVQVFTPEPEANGAAPKPGLYARFVCGVSEIDGVNKHLTSLKWNVLTSELSYIAKNNVELTEEQMKEVSEFLGDIDDCDDVHRIYVGLKQ